MTGSAPPLEPLTGALGSDKWSPIMRTICRTCKMEEIPEMVAEGDCCGAACLGAPAAAAAAAAFFLSLVVTVAPTWLHGFSTMELCSHSVQMLAWSRSAAQSLITISFEQGWGKRTSAPVLSANKYVSGSVRSFPKGASPTRRFKTSST